MPRTIPPPVLRQTTAFLRTATPAQAMERVALLTPRQRAAARLVALGWPDKSVGAELGVQFSAGRALVTRAIARTQLSNRTQLAVLMVRAEG